MLGNRVLIKDFHININKERVFNALDTIEGKTEESLYKRMDTLYNKALARMREVVSTRGVFEFKKNKRDLYPNILGDSEILLYSFFTLGEGVSMEGKKLFSKGKYLEAMVFDTMSNILLFEIGEEMSERINVYGSKLGIYIKDRMSPGDGGTPFIFQKTLWEELELKDLDIEINEKNIFKPLKSMGYIFTTSIYKQDQGNSSFCGKCQKLDCKLRKS